MTASKPKDRDAGYIFFRVAATAWLNHIFCRVRRCRREGRCLGRLSRHKLVMCCRQMSDAEVSEMLEFLRNTIMMATPAMVVEHLAEAGTQEERDMVLFRRHFFLQYHAEMAKAGLEEPLGPPFIDEPDPEKIGPKKVNP